MGESENTVPMSKVIIQVVIVAAICAVAVVIAQQLILGKTNVAVAAAIAATVGALTAVRARKSTATRNDK
jgi:hypothetical protein